MLSNIIMPQGSQDLVPARVVRWVVPEGSPVKKGDVICEVETEKAVFEINAPANGYLRKILVNEGEEAEIFSTIGYVGELDDPLPGEAPIAAAAPVAAQIAAVEVAADTPVAVSTGKVRITPKAKRMAKDLQVPIAGLVGSGPQGRIVAADVLAAQASTAAKVPAMTTPAPAVPAPSPAAAVTPAPAPVAAAPAVAPVAAAAPAPVFAAQPAALKVDQSLPGKAVTLNKIRKIIAQRMQLSKQYAPHFYVTVAVDMSEAIAYRQKYNRRPGLAKEDTLSINDMVVRACALALKEYPEVNASVLDENTLMMWDDIHIGIATALDEGLVVPVLEHADWLSLAQIPRQTRRLFSLAKEGKQASLASSHFTISNLGMFNVESFTAIINPPEAAILAVASIEKRVMPPAGDQLGVRVRDMMNTTLSLDHRIGDGVLAAKFTNRVRELLETPEYLE